MKRDSDEQLADIAKEFVRQGKSKRRWKLALILLFVGYVFTASYFTISQSDLLEDIVSKEYPFVAEVVLSGTIVGGGAIDADEAIKLLKNAFSETNSKAVILRINSPGGSPVQSSRIYKNINRLKKKFNKKLFVVVEDICTSGCYYIASSADGIYADESSIIGSIGVLLSSFGVVDAMEKLGIKRRLYTAGKYKDLLDPFSKEDKYITNFIKTNILDKSHNNFINAVKKGRGKKLSDDKNLFTGLIWLGEDAKKLGLIDGIADSAYVAKELIGVEQRILFEKKKTLLEELTQTGVKTLTPLLGQKIGLQ